nr:hypothetical protein BaRGS_005291 [Batillaria attramentaria]
MCSIETYVVFSHSTMLLREAVIMSSTNLPSKSTSPKVAEDIYPIDSKTDPHPPVFKAAPDLRLTMDDRILANRSSLSAQSAGPPHASPHQSDDQTHQQAQQHHSDSSPKPTDERSTKLYLATNDVAEDKLGDSEIGTETTGDFLGGGSRIKNRRIGSSPQVYETMPTISENKAHDEHRSATSEPSTSVSNSFSATYSASRTSSISSSTSNPAALHNSHLTVEGEWKVEVAQKQRKDEKDGVVVLAIVKWVVTIAMMLALLVCLISVKLSVLVLSKQLQAVTPSDQEDWTTYSAQFIVLYLLLSVPPLLNAVRAGCGAMDEGVWRVIVAFVALSIAWLPSFQQYITVAAAKTGEKEPAMEEAREVTNYNTFNNTFNTNLSNNDDTNTTSGVSSSVTTNPTQVTEHESKSDDKEMELSGGAEVLRPRATWKGVFIVHSCRVVFTFLVSALIYMLDSEGGPGNVFTDTVHTAFLDAWNLDSHVTDSTWTAFGLAIGAGLVGYVLAFGACHMNMMRGALAPPLVLATPLAVLVVSVSQMCDVIVGDSGSTCSWDTGNMAAIYVVAATVCFLLAPLLTFGWSLLRSAPVLLQQESVVFWLPGYNTAGLDTWLLVNRRRDVTTPDTSDKTGKKSKVYICTTMYREAEDEMRQLLESINEINKARAAGHRSFESHIIFDGGVRQRELSEFSLTLIGLLEETLGVRPEACTKVDTPYGLKLSWKLPGNSGKDMYFNIHLKDSLKVKNKKRWSQVMYMSYVLDFLTDGRDEDSFILTTDGDVAFTPDSVEALLDLMTRDHSIGAVCARTHPIGEGPLVWYQKFEYAIGHWFQKAAEHVLGSVLCAPGCFSVYRCRALADVLPKYARRVETAFDFLTKDMGEDRWLCTLMVQSGWRIEYCATSENRTNCPGHFDEFYKQRRRWIASTLANLMLIVKEWKYVRQFNHRVSNFFLLYQVLLLCSTLIGPSTIVLVVSGGLSYAWDVDIIATVVLQILLCIAFAILCVRTSQTTQLLVAKIYTFVYAVVMTAVSVGTAEQIVEDLNNSPGDTDISLDLPVSVTTLYFAGLAAMFVVAALLHLREFWNLAHALWYLLCLPSGYLVLTIYGVCNITDSSWGGLLTALP